MASDPVRCAQVLQQACRSGRRTQTGDALGVQQRRIYAGTICSPLHHLLDVLKNRREKALGFRVDRGDGDGSWFQHVLVNDWSPFERTRGTTVAVDPYDNGGKDTHCEPPR